MSPWISLGETLYFGGKPGSGRRILHPVTLELGGPGPVPSDVRIGDLGSVAKSIATAALKAGYDVQAARTDPDTGTTAIGGHMLGWAFRAHHHTDRGWTITIHRPGWPTLNSNIADLRRTLTSQTPTDIGKAR